MKLTPQDTSPPVALLEHVGQQFGATIALRDISLAIPARRMVGLIGPDGVGKSSLLSLIAGARTIEQGNVMVLGGDMRDVHHRREVCPEIAWMPQGLGKNLYHTLSVYENVDFFARLFGHDKAERELRINELLQSTGLAPFRDRPAGKLSGGMKQKLGLCCALIHDPQLLILDEPTLRVVYAPSQYFASEPKADISLVLRNPQAMDSARRQVMFALNDYLAGIALDQLSNFVLYRR